LSKFKNRLILTTESALVGLSSYQAVSTIVELKMLVFLYDSSQLLELVWNFPLSLEVDVPDIELFEQNDMQFATLRNL
jgi:hypothetical protein